MFLLLFAGEQLESVLGDNSKSFSSLTGLVSDKTLKAIEGMGFTDMMEIQYKSIRPLLEGRLVVTVLSLYELQYLLLLLIEIYWEQLEQVVARHSPF